MIVTPMGTFPRTGRVGGTIFTAPGLTNVGRSRIVPVQPRTNQQALVTAGMAVIANEWFSLTDFEQETWAPVGAPPSAGYPFYVAYNTPIIQWGLPPFTIYTFGVILPPIITPQLYAEPDGIHTTLDVFCGPGGTPGWQPWVRLYLKLGRITGDQTQIFDPSFTYVGSYELTLLNQHNYFDFTPVMAALGANWVAPTTFDTTKRTACGSSETWSYYYTDQIGRPAELTGTQPIIAGSFHQPEQIGAGLCPLSGSAPYPWPPSH